MRLAPALVARTILAQRYQEFQDLGGGQSVPGVVVEELPGRVARISYRPTFPFVYPFAWQQARVFQRAIEPHGYRVEWQGAEHPAADAVPLLIVRERPSSLDMQETIRLLRKRFPGYVNPFVTPHEAATFDLIQRLQAAQEGKLAETQLEEAWEATHHLLQGGLPPYRRA